MSYEELDILFTDGEIMEGGEISLDGLEVEEK